jgi:FtsH-binding integral membrane protein
MKTPKISTVLYANAIFCSLSALAILLTPGFIARTLIDLPSWAFIVLGIGLLLFALDVFVTARQENPSRAKLLYIFFADVTWVVLTPVVMIVLADQITGWGYAVLTDIALIVGAFAALEWIGMNKLRLSHDH